MDSKINPSLSAWLTRSGLGRLAWHKDHDATTPLNVARAVVNLSLEVSLAASGVVTAPTEDGVAQADSLHGAVLTLTAPNPMRRWETEQKQSIAFASVGRLCQTFGAKARIAQNRATAFSDDQMAAEYAASYTEAATALASALDPDLFTLLTDSDTLVRSFIHDFTPAAEPAPQALHLPPETFDALSDEAPIVIAMEPDSGKNALVLVRATDKQTEQMVEINRRHQARIPRNSKADHPLNVIAGKVEAVFSAELSKHLNIALAVRMQVPDYGDKPAAEVDDGPGLPDGPEHWDRRFLPSLTTAQPIMFLDRSRHDYALKEMEARDLAWGGQKVAHDTIIGRLDGGDDLVRVDVSTAVGVYDNHHPLETRVLANGVKLTEDGVPHEGRYIEASSLVAEDDPDNVISRRAWTMARAQANHAEVLRYWRGRMDYDKDAAASFFASNTNYVEHFNVRDLAGAAEYPKAKDVTRSTLKPTEPAT